jgi:SSS family solute:Na+ symporter
VYGVGALGFFALPYTIMVYPLAFVLLPALWRVCAQHGYLTVGDYVRGRYGSARLALAVTLTGLLATMPYVALQLLGIRAVLSAGGLYPEGVAGDAALTAAFAVLAVATWRSGLRASALIAVAKGSLVFGAVLGVVVAVSDRLGGPGAVFQVPESSPAGPDFAVLLDPSLHVAYGSLALGSAMALLMYPHVLTAALSAASARTVRRTVVLLPLWTAVLGLFGVLGLAALAAGVRVPAGGAEAAVPLLVADVLPPALTGLVFGALAIGALVPAAVMSVAAGALFSRNVFVEYLHPTATPVMQTRVARVTSLLIKIGAVLFVLGLRQQDAINLQLLGGVWILQTFPAVALGVWSRWLHRGAVLAGWATGMVLGTVVVTDGGFSSVVAVDLPTGEVRVYAAVVALAANLAVAAALTPVLDRLGVGRGLDATAAGVDR